MKHTQTFTTHCRLLKTSKDGKTINFTLIYNNYGLVSVFFYRRLTSSEICNGTDQRECLRFDLKIVKKGVYHEVLKILL